MIASTKKRRARFAGLALVALTLGTILMTAPTASAQWRRGGFYGGRPYYGGYGARTTVYNRGYGGLGGGFGGGNIYNRGYGGIGYGGLGYGGGGLYSGGFYGNGVAPIYSPIGVNNFGNGAYFGGVGGFY